MLEKKFRLFAVVLKDKPKRLCVGRPSWLSLVANLSAGPPPQPRGSSYAEAKSGISEGEKWYNMEVIGKNILLTEYKKYREAAHASI